MSIEIEKELKDVAEKIFDDMFQVRKYAGIAYCTEDEAEAKFWKGQYIALKRTREKIEDRMLKLILKREEKE